MTRLTTTIDKVDTIVKVITSMTDRKVVAVVKREPNVTITRIGTNGELVNIVTDDAVDVIHTTC